MDRMSWHVLETLISEWSNSPTTSKSHTSTHQVNMLVLSPTHVQNMVWSSIPNASNELQAANEAVLSLESLVMSQSQAANEAVLSLESLVTCQSIR